MIATSANRWAIDLNWVRGKWVINKKAIINDGYYTLNGYPSVNVAASTGYLSKMYPNNFQKDVKYGNIQVKNIGYFIYTRIVFNLGGKPYQGVVRNTYGVENSHTLISWEKVQYLKNMKDYGYGISIEFDYGFDNKYFFGYQPMSATVGL